jgi:hypothetical protein
MNEYEGELHVLYGVGDVLSWVVVEYLCVDGVVFIFLGEYLPSVALLRQVTV